MVNISVTALLEQMTLDEKIAQLMQITPNFLTDNKADLTGPMEWMGLTEENVANVGSVLSSVGAGKVIELQKNYMANNRLGIPLLFMADIIHGYRTIFPVTLAIGCSWDMELAERSAAIAAKESAVAGIHVTFAPMVDLVRDPRWGRVMESTGEDPYLNSEFARAFVRGFQGENLSSDTDRLAACVKHFAAYGAAEGGRDYNTVNMSERQLRESYLPAYKAALEEGCEMVMTAFNVVDGVPATGNKWLMRKLLREEWGFEGMLISDWGAVHEMIPHGAAEGGEQAARKAIQAGVDMEMMSSCYVNNLKQLVESGEIDEALIDESVLRVLLLKEKLGLFENPYRGADEQREKEVILCDEHRRAAREIAAKSSVLLKNEQVLPLHPGQRIALIGPFAQSGDILGPWSIWGSREEAVQLFEGISEKTAPARISVAQGCNIETGTEEQLAEALQAAQSAEVIVLALGERSEMSGEAGSRADIRLPQVQLDLIARLKQFGKPIAVVLFNGRPLDLHGVIDQADAVLEAWYPGTEGGGAIADVLFGDVNPSGRLTMSFPHSVGQIPVYYNNYNTGRPLKAENADQRYVSKYLDIPNAPLLPFGYGLSYTTFTYGKAKLSADVLQPGGQLTVTVEVANDGKRAGEEVVQLYMRDLVGEVVRPLKELKAFEKISLKPGEGKSVTFTLQEERLRYYHSDLSYESDAGDFQVFVGPNSRDVETLAFRLLK
ncbi:glycoside hydrolase family 3 N-terminal domain-containing protein [Paenibacillus sp. GCM10012307]|uniref:beta-glucosidase n=1 Tax=Paenibacillus roseus TaxID=2798579 RepID=A0A934MQY4_9BACL|nr:glycoside hydrolase family 3 N-terminal domain-containing protein [Paenibacillus roseus]MBJ6361809.1 glycoside hydrolase family 3 C-terminal domain-containing protein [Paenibacillus roseus]